MLLLTVPDISVKEKESSIMNNKGIIVHDENTGENVVFDKQGNAIGSFYTETPEVSRRRILRFLSEKEEKNDAQ